MAWLAILLICLAAGTLVAFALTRSRNPALGVLFGPGLASILYFAALAAGIPANPWVIAGVIAATAIGSWWRRKGEAPLPAKPWNWLLLGALLVAACFVLMDVQTAQGANPNGEWDASGIWNLRARFLAADQTWRRAITNEPGSYTAEISHPAYPLFLSSFVALMWRAQGAFEPAAPAVFSAAVGLAVLALLTGSLRRRSGTLAPLAGLLLTATAYFSSQASAQYSDLLLALAFLAAISLLDGAGEHAALAAAGLAIGLAPWIKNEGQPFALAALAVAAWRFRSRAVWVLLGAAPGLLATAALKLMSNGRESMFPDTAGEALAKLADPSRWWQVAAGFAGAVANAGQWWAHPVLLAAAIAFAVRFLPAEELRGRVWLAIPLAATFAAEFGIYLITTSDLAWHISTSASRLLLQLWPATLWLLFTLLRAPEDRQPAALPPEKEGKRAKRRKQPALS